MSVKFAQNIFHMTKTINLKYMQTCEV